MSGAEPDQVVVSAESTGQRVALGLSASAFAVALGLLVGAVALLLAGENPLRAYGAMVDGAFGSSFALGETLSRAAPLAITGLGAAVALRAGLVTIGAQGQVILGAVGAILTAFVFEGAPGIIAVPAAAVGGALFGAAWVLIPALLRAFFNVNEILSTLLFTEFANLLIVYLLNNPMKPERAITPQSEPFPSNATLGLVVGGTRFHLGVLFALVVAAAFWWWTHSPVGFRYDLYGENPRLAVSLGVPARGVVLRALLLSGAAAGLVGWIQAAGLLQRLYPEIASDIGFFGLVVAFLGGATPGGILAAALLFGALRAGGLAMQSSEGVPASLSDVIQAIILIGFAIRYAPRIAALTRRISRAFRLIPGTGAGPRAPAADPGASGGGRP